MPKNSKCVVPHCGHAQQRHKDCIYAKFPKDIERCKKWLQVVGVPDLIHLTPEKLNQIRYVCGCHFPLDNFLNVSRKKLKTTAVPSIVDDRVIPLDETLLRNFPPGGEKKISMNVSGFTISSFLCNWISFASATFFYWWKYYCLQAVRVPIPDEDFRRHFKEKGNEPTPNPGKSNMTMVNSEEAASSSGNSHTVEGPFIPVTLRRASKRPCPSVARTRITKKRCLELIGMDDESEEMSPREAKMLRIIQQQNAELMNKNLQLQESKDALKKMKMTGKYSQVLNDVSLPVLHQLLESNSRNKNRETHGQRWTLDEKLTALSIFKRGPSAYAHLKQLLPFPSIKTVLRTLREIPMNVGINQQIINSIKSSVEEMSAIDKYCILTFDEISLKRTLLYNDITGTVTGFEDYGNGNRTDKMADHAVVFMLQGIDKPYKVMISHYFSEHTVSSARLKLLIMENIEAADSTGLIVKAIVCDQGATNRGATRMLIEESKTDKPGEYFLWKDKRKIYRIFDWPHLFKCLRNNYMGNWEKWVQDHPEFDKENYPGHSVEWNNKRTNYKDLMLLFEEEKSSGMINNKLTESHVFPGSKEKMRVKYATQLFSNTNARALKLLSKNANNEQMKGFSDTSDFLKDVNTLFDFVNGPKHSNEPSDSPRQNVSLTSNHVEEWGKYRKLIMNMKFINAKNQVFTPECQKNLVKSLSAIQDLWQELRKLGFKQLILRNINQDPVENLFALIRQNCGDEKNPTCLHFEAALKSVLVTKFAASHPPGSNCEEDNREYLTSLYDFFPRKERQQNLDVCSNVDAHEPASPPVLHIEDFEMEEELNCDIPIERNGDKRLCHLSQQVLKKIKLECQECMRCLVDQQSMSATQLPDLHELQKIRKISCNLREMLLKSIKIFDQRIKPKIHVAEIKCIALQELISNTNSGWLTCDQHGHIIAHGILTLAVQFLISNECKLRNRSAKEKAKSKGKKS